LFFVFFVYQSFFEKENCFCFGSHDVAPGHIKYSDLLVVLAIASGLFFARTSQENHVRRVSLGFASVGAAFCSVLVLFVGWGQADDVNLVSPCDWVGHAQPMVPRAGDEYSLDQSEWDVLVLKQTCDVCTQWLETNFGQTDIPSNYILALKNRLSGEELKLVQLDVPESFGSEFVTPVYLSIKNGVVESCEGGLGEF